MQASTTYVGRRRRPRAVSFVASLLLFESVLVALAGILTGALMIAAIPPLMIGPDDLFGPYITILPGLGLATLTVVVGGGLALAGIGLLRMRESGWVLAMALQGVGLANALYAHLNGDQQYPTLALCSFVVLVLNQREVRQSFQAQPEHA